MRRIQRDIDFEELVSFFGGGERAVFKEIWQILLFAACLGHSLGERREIRKSDAGKAMPEGYFSKCLSWPGVLYLLGLTETESADILKAKDENEDNLIRTFEEYSSRGLQELQKASEKHDDPLDALLEVISEHAGSKTAATSTINLDGLI